MAQQRWGVDVWEDGEDVANRVSVFGVAQASADGGFGDVGEWDICCLLYTSDAADE